MLDWLQREMHALDPRDLHNLEQATADDPNRIVIGNLLAPQAVDLNLPARSRASVLRELVRLAERTGMVYDPPALVAALEEREGLCSTALRGGFAFPHPRRPLPYATAEPLVCIARVPAGLPFGSPDGELTDLFALLCSHEERSHLHVLARLSQLFSSDLPAKLRELDDPQAALELILTTEQTLLAKRPARR
jgi:PTS system nitrogen regulatory IIA component